MRALAARSVAAGEACHLSTLWVELYGGTATEAKKTVADMLKVAANQWTRLLRDARAAVMTGGADIMTAREAAVRLTTIARGGDNTEAMAAIDRLAKMGGWNAPETARVVFGTGGVAGSLGEAVGGVLRELWDRDTKQIEAEVCDEGEDEEADDAEGVSPEPAVRGGDGGGPGAVDW
jgi:hypothetical protein